MRQAPPPAPIKVRSRMEMPALVLRTSPPLTTDNSSPLPRLPPHPVSPSRRPNPATVSSCSTDTSPSPSDDLSLLLPLGFPFATSQRGGKQYVARVAHYSPAARRRLSPPPPPLSRKLIHLLNPFKYLASE
jgi:hypothetical protein